MASSMNNGLLYYSNMLGQFVTGSTTTNPASAPATSSAVSVMFLGNASQDITLATNPTFSLAAFIPGNPTNANSFMPNLASNLLVTSSTSSAVLKMRLLFWGCAISDDPSVVGTTTTFLLQGYNGTAPTTLDIFNITESGMSNGSNLIASNWVTVSSIPAPPKLVVHIASAVSSLATYRVAVGTLEFVMST